MSKKGLIGIVVFLIMVVIILIGVISTLLNDKNAINKNAEVIENQDIAEDNKENTLIPEVKEENEEDDIKTEENNTNNLITNEKISDNWEEVEFLYNGKKVKLICNFSELQQNLGLKFNDEAKNEYILNPNYTTSGGSCTIGNEEQIVVNLLNSSNEAKKYTECDVDYFGINIYSLKRNGNNGYSKIELSKGIYWDSTLQDIIQAYGEPDKRDDGSNFSNLFYKSDRANLQFTIYEDYGLTAIYYNVKD